MGKKLFVVRGSEDGNLGVFSNVKLAYARALAYFEGGGVAADQLTMWFQDPHRQTVSHSRVGSYDNVCRKLSGIGLATIESAVPGNRMSVEIEEFYLNQL